jgi:hypothetical protein
MDFESWLLKQWLEIQSGLKMTTIWVGVFGILVLFKWYFDAKVDREKFNELITRVNDLHRYSASESEFNKLRYDHCVSFINCYERAHPLPANDKEIQLLANDRVMRAVLVESFAESGPTQERGEQPITPVRRSTRLGSALAGGAVVRRLVK